MRPLQTGAPSKVGALWTAVGVERTLALASWICSRDRIQAHAAAPVETFEGGRLGASPLFRCRPRPVLLQRVSNPIVYRVIRSRHLTQQAGVPRDRSLRPLRIKSIWRRRRHRSVSAALSRPPGAGFSIVGSPGPGPDHRAAWPRTGSSGPTRSSRRPRDALGGHGCAGGRGRAPTTQAERCCHPRSQAGGRG